MRGGELDHPVPRPFRMRATIGRARSRRGGSQDGWKGCVGCLALLLLVFGGQLLKSCRQTLYPPAPPPAPTPAPAPAPVGPHPAAPASVPPPVDAEAALAAADLGKFSLERREDIEQVRKVYARTKQDTESLAHWNNTAILLWLLDRTDPARQVIEALFRAFPDAEKDDGILLNAFLITGDARFDKPGAGKSVVVAKQRMFNLPQATNATYEDIAGSAELPPRLRAKALCMLGVRRAEKAVASRQPADLEAALESFRKAKATDPEGSIGKIAEENRRRLEAWFLASGLKRKLAALEELRRACRIADLRVALEQARGDFAQDPGMAARFGILEQALRNLSAANSLLALGRRYDAGGERGKAKRYFAAVLALAPDTTWGQEAQAYLDAHKD